MRFLAEIEETIEEHPHSVEYVRGNDDIELQVEHVNAEDLAEIAVIEETMIRR